MTTIQHWLVVKANGGARLHSKEPSRMKLDEFCIPVTVDLPDVWGKTLDEGFVITMPNPPTVTQGGLMPPVGEPKWQDEQQATA